MAASIYDRLTAQWLKDRFLVGVDLTLDDGTEYPDGIYEQSIVAAVAYLERELGIVIEQRTISAERHDALAEHRSAWWPFVLDHRPVQSVTGLKLRYGSFAPVDMPLSWIQLLAPVHGKLQLVPSAESVGSFQFTAGMPLITGDVFQPVSYVPGYFEFDYSAGFDIQSGQATVADGETSVAVSFPRDMLLPTGETYAVYLRFDGDDYGGVIKGARDLTASGFNLEMTTAPSGGDAHVDWYATAVPPDIEHVIGLRASLLPLDVAGDLISGAGVANTSISADGLSQTLGTTSSATNAGYGARVLQFERELKGQLKALRAKYRIPGFLVV